MPQSHTSDRCGTALERACRSAVGDRLRTVTLREEGEVRTVYRRTDLSRDADATVHEQLDGEDVVVADGGRTVGEFDQGYVAHVRVGESAVVVTTDGLRMDRENELSTAVRSILAESR